jgi:hypothetical protein
MICIVWVIGLVGQPQRRKWPSITSEVVNYHFQSAQDARAQTKILSADGAELYILESYSYSAAPKTSAFEFSGDFECALHSVDKSDRFDTLLTELPNADADWQSRGRFLSSQLLPPCGNYDQLGRTRTFRLRGFRLTLSLSRIEFDKKLTSIWNDAPALRSFDLKVEVATDESAVSEIAAPPALPPFNTLPKACSKPFESLYLSKLR